jgi:hypothetical protein
MQQENMGDFVDEVLTGRKRKKEHEIRESIVNVKEILEQDEADKSTQSSNGSNDKVTIGGRDEDDEPKESRFKGSTKVMTVKLSIGDKDYPPMEVSKQQYEKTAITDFSSLVSMFDIDKRKLVAQDSSPTSFTLVVEESVSKSGNNSVSISLTSNTDQTISAKVALNGESTAFDLLDSAVKHFDQLFLDNIIKTVDKELQSENE